MSVSVSPSVSLFGWCEFRTALSFSVLAGDDTLSTLLCVVCGPWAWSVMVHVHGLWSMFMVCGPCSWSVVHVHGLWSMFMVCGPCSWSVVHVHGLWSMFMVCGPCVFSGDTEAGCSSLMYRRHRSSSRRRVVWWCERCVTAATGRPARRLAVRAGRTQPRLSQTTTDAQCPPELRQRVILNTGSHMDMRISNLHYGGSQHPVTSLGISVFVGL